MQLDDAGVVAETDWSQESALPVPTDAPGVFLLPAAFEQIVDKLRRGVSVLADTEPDLVGRLFAPPVIARSTVERTGYPASFPHLLGTVHGFTGDSKRWSELSPLVESGGDWQSDHTAGDLVLLPAACYPIYEMLAGRHLSTPVTHMIEGRCFRQESTYETGRMRCFRQLELVTAGDAEHCSVWRDSRLARVSGWLESLGLKVTIDDADDPFFGSAGRLYQAAQRRQQLKFELRVPIDRGLIQPVSSANWHKDHFGTAFSITAGGAAAPAHTACIGLGLERIALALINAHGPCPASWPPAVSTALTAPETGAALA